MTTRRIHPVDRDTELLARILVSSLPLSFALDGEQSELTALTGSPGWPARAAGIAAVDRTAVVFDPELQSDSAVRSILETPAAALRISESFAGNPALTPLRDAAPEQLSAAHTVTMLSTGKTPEQVLFEQIRVLRALGWQGVRIIDAQVAPRSVLVTAEVRRGEGTTLIRLHAAGTQARTRHSLRSFTTDGLVSVDLPPADTAEPAAVHIVTPDGATVLPTIYETAHRVTLRTLGQASPARAITDFVDDVALVNSIVR